MNALQNLCLSDGVPKLVARVNSLASYTNLQCFVFLALLHAKNLCIKRSVRRLRHFNSLIPEISSQSSEPVFGISFLSRESGTEGFMVVMPAVMPFAVTLLYGVFVNPSLT